MESLVGKTISHYQIIELAGAGGMGEVYRARDSRLNRFVAIKALPEIFSSDPERRSRLEREARVLASLSHPNIASIFGLEQSEGRSYLVLEYIAGKRLSEHISGAPLPVAKALETCLQIACGVEAAHESGIVHRDLKPGNVMITREGRAVVVDFGLAKEEVDRTGSISPESPTLTDSPARAHPSAGAMETSPGIILGTTAYLSPEQARGLAVDRRTDIWAFGCVLYECLTGRRAFEGETTMDLIAQILTAEPDWAALPKNTPATVRGMLQACLEKEPSKRLPSIGEARLVLEAAKTDRGSGRSFRRSHVLVTVGALAVLTIGALLWFTLGRDSYLSTRHPGEDPFSASSALIAVLPFEDMSPGKDQTYFSDGLSEDVINALGRVRGLRVVSRSSSFQFRGKNADLATIADKLNVRLILEGSVRQSGDRLRVTARLTDVPSGASIWAHTYDRNLGDVFAVQDEIARSVAASVGNTAIVDAEATTARIEKAVKSRRDIPEVYRLRMEIRLLMRELPRDAWPRLLETTQRLSTFFKPESAIFLQLQAQEYSLKARLKLIPEPEARQKRLELLTRALALEPGNAEINDRIAMLHFSSGDPVRAEPFMRRALELAPGVGEFFRGVADVDADLGRLDDALRGYKAAAELDPLSRSIHNNLGIVLSDLGRHVDAEASFRKALELAPDMSEARVGLAQALLGQGRFDEAISEAIQIVDDGWRFYALALAYDGAKQKVKADAAVQELIQSHAEDMAYQIAEIYAARADIDNAFAWLERARIQQDGGLGGARTDASLQSLHSDPRWKPFLEKLGNP